MHKRLGLSALAALALTTAMTAQAEVAPGFYVGAGFGTTEISEESIEDFTADDSDTGLKVFGGTASTSTSQSKPATSISARRAARLKTPPSATSTSRSASQA
jgi:hypothetical protein